MNVDTGLASHSLGLAGLLYAVLTLSSYKLKIGVSQFRQEGRLRSHTKLHDGPM